MCTTNLGIGAERAGLKPIQRIAKVRVVENIFFLLVASILSPFLPLSITYISGGCYSWVGFLLEYSQVWNSCLESGHLSIWATSNWKALVWTLAWQMYSTKLWYCSLQVNVNVKYLYICVPVVWWQYYHNIIMRQFLKWTNIQMNWNQLKSCLDFVKVQKPSGT